MEDAIAQKVAQKGFFVVLTARKEANASPLAKAIGEQGGERMIVELDQVSQESISAGALLSSSISAAARAAN